MSRAEAVSIIGLGAGGTAAARLALAKGETVYVSDISTDPATRARARDLEALGARVQLGSHDVPRIQASSMVVVSPGIPAGAPVLRELRARDVRWISEPEFAVRFYKGSLIAVTGTNGKTTTTALSAHLLSTSGISVAWGGNVGAAMAPAASELALREPPPRWYVLEVSSFQLADVETFAPDIGVVTNLAVDHLDRYPDTRAYFSDKARLFDNAEATSTWVLNGDDPSVLALPGGAAGRRYLFAGESIATAASDGARAAAFVRDGMLTLRLPDEDESGAAAGNREEVLLPSSSLRLLGRHNVMNALAAALTARIAGASSEGIREGLAGFRPLPHRLEPVEEREGVLYVNDSKATNVAAAVGAVESLERPLIVLLGGKDKGEDFRPLARALRGRARAAVLYGEAGPRLSGELSEAFSAPAAAPSSPSEGSLEDAPALVAAGDDFDAAVRKARTLARAGDAVVLSPACSSFDLFSGYEARGRRFADLVSDRGDA